MGSVLIQGLLPLGVWQQKVFAIVLGLNVQRSGQLRGLHMQTFNI